MLDERIKMVDERKCHCESLWVVAIPLMFLVGCTFIDDYDIDLMQDAKASVESSSSVSSTGSSTGSETLSSSAKVRSSSSRNAINSSSAKKVASSSSNSRNDVESSSAKAPSSSSTNPESSNTESAKSSGSQTVNSSSSTVVLFKCGTKFEDSESGTSYATIRIKTQCWFAENLKINTTNSVCNQDDSKNCEKYGRLYPWRDAEVACPEGSRLPELNDWETLETSLGNAAYAGFYMKSENAEWKSANNDAGFSALPAGYYDAEDGEYIAPGFATFFWSASDEDGTLVKFVGLRNASDNIEYGEYSKSYKLSVRCIVDNFK